MNYVNNWIHQIELTEGATAIIGVDLPDGLYRLTITDSQSEPTRWEIVQALVTGQAAALERGLEGTFAQNWPAGSVIYNAITAGALVDMDRRLAILGGSAGWVDLPVEVGWVHAPQAAAQARFFAGMLEFRGELQYQNTIENDSPIQLPLSMRVAWPAGITGDLYFPVAAHGNGVITSTVLRVSADGLLTFDLSEVAAAQNVVLDGLRYSLRQVQAPLAAAGGSHWAPSALAPPVAIRADDGPVRLVGEFFGNDLSEEAARFVGTVPAGYRPAEEAQVLVTLLGTEQYEQAGSSATITPDGRITLDIVPYYDPCTVRFNGQSTWAS